MTYFLILGVVLVLDQLYTWFESLPTTKAMAARHLDGGEDSPLAKRVDAHRRNWKVRLHRGLLMFWGISFVFIKASSQPWVIAVAVATIVLTAIPFWKILFMKEGA